MTEQATLFTAQVHRMDFDADSIYTSIGREIIRWDKKTKQALTVYTLPPNDNLNKGARFAVDERSIYGNSIYFFHVMDKRSGEVTYQQRFGRDNQSDLDLGTVLVDEGNIYFPVRNRGLAVVDKRNYDRVCYLNEEKGSVWALAQDESTIYLGGVDKNIYAFEKATLKHTATFSGHKGNIHDLFSFQDYLVSVSADNSLIFWDKKSASPVQHLKKIKCSLGCAAMTEQYLVCAAKGTMRICDTKSWALLQETPVSFGTMFFDDGVIYIANRKVPRVDVFTIEDAVRGNAGRGS